LTAARDRGFSLPILWNSSGYETVDALKLLSDIVERSILPYPTDFSGPRITPRRPAMRCCIWRNWRRRVLSSRP
jgi:hypothetical protein